jgi:putative ABC transport system ATP-binding protein
VAEPDADGAAERRRATDPSSRAPQARREGGRILTTAPAVRLDRVTKCYGDGRRAVEAIAQLSLEVPVAQFLSVVGPSGSGKSTLLNLIAGLDRPTEGTVYLHGEDLSQLTDDERSDLRLRRIGFVFQNFNLFPSFTVQENVAWPLEFLGVGWQEARERARSSLERVGLPSRCWSRRPAELSGGEQQRVAIARAVVTEPRLVLADEPTGNLDSKSGTVVLELMRRLNEEEGITIVLVTHSALAARYSHRRLDLQRRTSHVPLAPVQP